jgi:hypothetical protein
MMIYHCIYEERDGHSFIGMKSVQLISNVLKLYETITVSDFVLWQPRKL